MSETIELIIHAHGGVSKEITAHMHKQDKRIAELENHGHEMNRICLKKSAQINDLKVGVQELEEAVNILAVYACRYAHTRQTGAANQIVNTLARIAPSITPEHRAKIIHEAVEATCNFDDWGRLGKIFNWGEALGGEDDGAV